MTGRWTADRHRVALVGMVGAAVLLLVALVLGLVSFIKMRQVVTEEFNAQQLVLARNLAILIHQDIDFLRRELLVLARSPLVAAAPPGQMRELMRVALASIEGGEVLEARYLDAQGRIVETVDREGQGRPAGPDDYGPAQFVEWAGRAHGAERVLIVPARRSSLELLMVTPRAPGAATGTDPRGIFVFVVDAAAVARRFTADARSGTTGYAWVLDQGGRFLAHPMDDFIGKNAFTARHEKDPRLGFESINVIMRDFMLEGEEGLGEYDSAWHRQAVGPVRKLMAYCPIAVDPGPPRLLWSVAVVAPVSEVQAMVRELFLRQLGVQLAIVLGILAGGISLLRMERYWSAVKREKEHQVNMSSRLASLGTLAAGVAHEVNNPLAIILGFTDLLLERAPAGTDEHEQLAVIQRQATACKKIVENLGSFARIPQAENDEMDVGAELRRVLVMVRNTLLTEKIVCAVEIEDGLPRVRGQAQGFQQVLLNLVANARAAMKSGGTLTVRARPAEEGVEVEVSDTGHGIAQRDLEHVFDPFFTTKAPGEGTGLGLSISHGIVQQAGGTMTVESRDRNEVGPERCGTTFRILLAAAGRHPSPPRPAAPAAHATGG